MKRVMTQLGDEGMGGESEVADWEYGDGSRAVGDEWELGFFFV